MVGFNCVTTDDLLCRNVHASVSGQISMVVRRVWVWLPLWGRMDAVGLDLDGEAEVMVAVPGRVPGRGGRSLYLF